MSRLIPTLLDRFGLRQLKSYKLEVGGTILPSYTVGPHYVPERDFGTTVKLTPVYEASEKRVVQVYACVGAVALLAAVIAGLVSGPAEPTGSPEAYTSPLDVMPHPQMFLGLMLLAVVLAVVGIVAMMPFATGPSVVSRLRGRHSLPREDTAVLATFSLAVGEGSSVDGTTVKLLPAHGQDALRFINAVVALRAANEWLTVLGPMASVDQVRDANRDVATALAEYHDARNAVTVRTAP